MTATVIVGCGNLLRGDDGFGCLVAQRLTPMLSPRRDIEIVDAGSAAGPYINLLSSENDPPSLIVIDAGMFGARRGELRLFTPGEMGADTGGHSLHGWPLQSEITRYPGAAKALLCQVDNDGTNGMSLDVSSEVRDAVAHACTMVCQMPEVRT
ncbi:MAG TPA: hydrogenase maturation protease [Methanomicrobia archaeon]|nr:hydrogenase maturation protease [Methanomicrobia archaeon]